MMKTGSWWKRLGEAFRGPSSSPHVTDEFPKVGTDGLLADPAEAVEPDAASAPDKALGPLARWNRRDQTLAKLQEGYEQVTRVIQEIENHLVAQADRSERICNSLEQLARATSELPTATRLQTETLETIAAHIEATSSRTQQMAESLSQVPKLAKTQSETLVSINRQLEMAGEQRVLASQTLDRIGGALGTLSTTSQTQTERLKMIGARAEEQVDLLSQMIARQNRRFIMLFVVTVLLAIGALAAVSFLVWVGRAM